jgi:hypothetical protein
VDADLGAHEVRAQRRRRDQQGHPLPGDGVVVADLAIVRNAQDLPPGLRGIGDEGRAVLRGGLGEAGVVLGQIDRGQPAVGGLDAGDAGQPELLRQPVLQRPEDPLGAAARLRRVGGDVLDAELRKRPADLVSCVRDTLPPAAGVWK